MSGNWQKDLILAEEREAQQRQGLERPFGMYVASVSSDSEVMKVSYFGNRDRPISLPHPFISTGSWIRAMPEVGASYVGIFRSDESAPQALSTVQRQAQDRIDSFRKQVGVYRSMSPGEIELNSVGTSQLFLARRPSAEVRGGSIQRWADQDKLQVGDRGPIHTKQLIGHSSSAMGDEYRLGIVTRPKSTWEVLYPKVSGNYAAEEFLQMKNPSGQNPAVLFREQRGHVLDDRGAIIQQGVTKLPLRYKETLYANDNSFTTLEVDENGNILQQLTASATDGYDLQIPGGKWTIEVGKDHIVVVNGNQTVTVKQSAVMSVAKNLTVEVTGNVIINTTGDTNITTTGKTNIKSTGEMNLESTGKTTVKGSQIILNSQGSGITTANGHQNVIDLITMVPVLPSTTTFGDI